MKGLGMEHTKSKSFDEGYDAGFKAGVEYGKQLAKGEADANTRRGDNGISDMEYTRATGGRATEV